MQPASMPDARNLILAIVISTAGLLSWQLLIEEPKRQAALELARQKQLEQAQHAEAADVSAPIIELKGANEADKAAPSRQAQLAAAPRIRIDTPTVHGSVSLQGLRIDDLTLARYRQQLDANSDEVVLLSPAGTKDGYFAEFGWLSDDASIEVPTAKTQWESDQKRLSSSTPLEASWVSAQGIRFQQTIRANEPYLFTIEQKVRNTTDAPVTLYPYGLINRAYEDESKHFAILHEGPIGVLGGELNEVSYETLREDGASQFTSKGGWLGITDKYWLAAMIPDRGHSFSATMNHALRANQNRYQIDYRGDAVTIPPGESVTITQRLFAGAKEVSLLDDYAARYEIPLFDRAVDFGSLYFLTKPIFGALNYFYGLLGNFGLAIMLLTVCIKILLFPLANKSYVAMSQLKNLMPKITEIKERYADDRVKMNTEIMEFYKRERVNPASGCLPMLLQLPVFFALYKVLFVTIEMRHAPFYGWVHDLSAPDPTTVFNLFGLIDWAPPAFFMIGAWPLIMCATMVIQQRLNPKPTDPAQAMVMTWLPYVFLFMFASFPAGLVIYWAWNNTLSIVQQWLITRRYQHKHGTS